MKEPAAFAAIKDDMHALNDQLKQAQSASHDGKRLSESLWPVLKLNHQRSRLVHDALREGRIDRETAEWCVERGWADKALMGKWRKSGYGRLCCGLCVQAGRVCVCRVPEGERAAAGVVECEHCGCRGCAG
jgi:bud site selection protein 31